MKVQMIATAAGPDGVFLADKIYDVPTDIAKSWVEHGHARFVDRTKETATMRAATETTTRDQKGDRRGTPRTTRN